MNRSTRFRGLTHASLSLVVGLFFSTLALAMAVQTPTEPPADASTVPLGTKQINPQDGLDYVWIPPGTFQMGCSSDDTECTDDEKPSHAVTMTRGFWIAQTEITVGAYDRFARAARRSMPAEPMSQDGVALNERWQQTRQPIVQVTANDARAYCEWADGRLPTEAEWEYAARAGTTDARYGSLEQIAWYADTSGESPLDSRRLIAEKMFGRRFRENRNRLHDVAQKTPNAFGLYDTLGNAWEWVSDWYDDKYYGRSPSQDPTGPSSGQAQILRGGAWNSPPWHVRVSDRIVHPSGVANIVFGYRCVWENPSKDPR
jgi:sulfatase modifying factor 1